MTDSETLQVNRIVNLDCVDQLDDAVRTLLMLTEMTGETHRIWRGGAWDYTKA